jgi:hypothetical protein
VVLGALALTTLAGRLDRARRAASRRRAAAPSSSRINSFI